VWWVLGTGRSSFQSGSHAAPSKCGTVYTIGLNIFNSIYLQWVKHYGMWVVVAAVAVGGVVILSFFYKMHLQV
jgi:hypothetical protein